MKAFTVINENLLFKDATILFSFYIPKYKDKYVLYYVVDLQDYVKKLLVGVLDETGEYSYIMSINENDLDTVKLYIEKLLNGEGTREEIKINRDSVNIEPNICQMINETGNDISFTRIDDIEWALDNLKDDYFNNFVYLNELNDAIYNLIVSRDNKIKKQIEKENIKGNINIFLLTLFAVLFLMLLLFMGYNSFINL